MFMSLCSCPYVHVPMFVFLCSCPYVHVPMFVFLCLCSYGRVPMFVFLCLCSYGRVPVFVFLCSCSCVRVPVFVFLCSCSCVRVPVFVFLCSCFNIIFSFKQATSRLRGQALRHIPLSNKGKAWRSQHKGGGLFKMIFQIKTQFNTCEFSCFEADDAITNLHVALERFRSEVSGPYQHNRVEVRHHFLLICYQFYLTGDLEYHTWTHTSGM